MKTIQITDDEQLLNSIEAKIGAHSPEGYDVVIHRNDIRRDGDWIYVVVHPSDPSVRASQYMRYLEEIEEELKHELGANILLVPTIED